MKKTNKTLKVRILKKNKKKISKNKKNKRNNNKLHLPKAKENLMENITKVKNLNNIKNQAQKSIQMVIKSKRKSKSLTNDPFNNTKNLIV